MRAVHSHWPSAQWWRVGAWVVQVAREVAGSAIERARRDWQVARRCLPVWGSRSTHRWVRGRLADWSCALSVLTGPAHNGGAWVRGWSTSRASCCKWIRTRASLLASSAHLRQCVESGQAWWGARRLADWSCAHCVLMAQCMLWWRVGARVVQAARKLIEVDPSARVVAGK